MKKYMLILFENENAYDGFSPEDMQKEIEAHSKWIEELDDRFVSGDPLEKTAKTVKGKEKVLTDGPYIESKELVTGYYMINANNLQEAAEIAKGCPVLKYGGNVEVREVMDIM